MKETNFRRFLILWMGQLISSIGGGLTSFGLGVYVFEKTGSAAGMALVTLLGFFPTLLLSVPAGVLADRYDRRLLMMLGDGFSGMGVLFLLICMIRGEASLFQICIGVLISAVFSSLLDPAYEATVSDLLTAEEYSKASGLVSLAGSARYLVSPVIAGILLSVSDIKLLLVIDIGTFLLTVISTFVVKRGIKAKKNMINHPEIIFADEPTGALNKGASEEVMDALIALNREGTTILMVTHDSRMASRCGRILYLLDGQIRGELILQDCPEKSLKQREEMVNRWLAKMEW